jgi:hypothetical protein
MKPSVDLTGLTALTGAVIGVAAFVLSLTNYLRDKPKVVVKLMWDRGITDNPKYDPRKLWGLVVVSNVGRRPIYIRMASLKLPKGYKLTHFVLSEGIKGMRLAEGDEPACFVISQDGLEEYGRDWRKIRAIVFDSADTEYCSQKLPKTDKPSWVKDET